MPFFRRPPMFEPTSEGGFAVGLTPEARSWVVDLAGQLDEILESDSDDTRRLFPTAYPDDPDLNAGYEILARQSLIDGRREAIDLMRQSVTKEVLSHEELTAWMSIVNDLRLVLGTRLDVSEDDYELDESHPDFELQLMYHQLGLVVSDIVDALSTTLPPPGEQERDG